MTVLFFGFIAQNGAITHLVALLTDRGVSPARAATALAAMGGASLVGRFITGWLLDRFFAPRVTLGLLTAAALGTLVLSGAHSFAAGMFASILIGLGMGGEADVTPYILSRYFGLRVVRDALRLHVDCLRRRRRDRAGAHGMGVRCRGLVRNPVDRARREAPWAPPR